VFEFKSKEKFELDHLTTVIKHGKWWWLGMIKRMITVVLQGGCYNSPPLQEISSRDLSGEVKG
jgi:hypothetical protein